MKNVLTPARSLAVPLLVGSWIAAFAQSLGVPSAQAWIGRPLEMTVPARLAGETGDDCVHADVFFGERRLKAADVRTSVVGTGEQRRVRVETTALVDEPFVTVTVRAGCRGTITRDYTLLPEIASETMLASLAARREVAAVAAGSAGSPAVAPRLARPTVPIAPRVPLLRPVVVAAGEGGAAPRVRTARALRPDAPAAGARLRLEPVEFDQQIFLRVTANLSEPAGDAARRASAALLWQAINADPQQQLRTTAVLQKLETDLAQLRQASGHMGAEMAALRTRLDEARPWYPSGSLVPGLILLVLAIAAAAAMLWYRSRRAMDLPEPWYVPEGRAEVPAPPVQPLAPVVPVAVAAARPDTASIGFELPAPPSSQPTQPRRASTGVLRVETLAATFEETAFLSSLGLMSDAMDVLMAYLQGCGNPAPLAFFELMRLCDQAGDAAAVATVRRRYAQAFGVEAPRLEQLTASVGLESLSDVSGRVTRAWGHPEALEVIEQALFNAPRPRAPLTLEAGRDLLALHELALTLATAPAEAEARPLAPWAQAEDVVAATQAAAEAAGGHRFALDVDLGAAPEALPEKQEQPDSRRLAPLLAQMQVAAREAAARRDAARPAEEEEDAFSAAVASERSPLGRL